MERQIILEAWNGYRRKLLDPVGAGPVQIEETRRAFYAGAISLLTAIMMGLDPGAEATDADLGRMAAIERELQRYAADLQRRGP